MSSAGPIDLRCEIRSSEGRIEGRVSDGRGRFVPFRGWIELSAALTSFVEDASPHKSDTDPSQKEQSND